jgi:hypothetical protein
MLCRPSHLKCYSRCCRNLTITSMCARYFDGCTYNLDS